MIREKEKRSGKKSSIVSVMFKTNFFKYFLYFFFLVGFGFLSTFPILVKFNSSNKVIHHLILQMGFQPIFDR